MARTTMAALIAKVRLMIADPPGDTQQFDNDAIQDALDETRDDIRYLLLSVAPTIANTASTGNVPSTIYADYYSDGYQWWEDDVVLQGNNTSTGAAWVVLTPVASDLIVGHWQFELTPFVNGTAPSQWPPVFLTGKCYDLNLASANLLDFWAATLTCKVDFSAEGFSVRNSQMMAAKSKLADLYRQKAKPRTTKMIRRDVLAELITTTPYLGPEIVRGRYS